MDLLGLLLIASGIGLFAGGISGLLGVGGGVVMVPAFMRLLGMQAHQAIAASLSVIVVTSLAGSLKHQQLGNFQDINWRIILVVALLSIVGSYLGASLTGRFSDRTLRIIFGIFLMMVSIQILVKAAQQPPSDAAPAAIQTETGTEQ